MMKTNIYSVFDSKTATFGRPFTHLKDASAIRDFADAVNDSSNPNNQWNKHPEDFSLFKVGEFDDESGELIPSLPVNLITASAISATNKSTQEIIQ